MPACRDQRNPSDQYSATVPHTLRLLIDYASESSPSGSSPDITGKHPECTSNFQDSSLSPRHSAVSPQHHHAPHPDLGTQIVSIVNHFSFQLARG
jgi:hypothetical protein